MGRSRSQALEHVRDAWVLAVRLNNGDLITLLADALVERLGSIVHDVQVHVAWEHDAYQRAVRRQQGGILVIDESHEATSPDSGRRGRLHDVHHVLAIPKPARETELLTVEAVLGSVCGNNALAKHVGLVFTDHSPFVGMTKPKVVTGLVHHSRHALAEIALEPLRVAASVRKGGPVGTAVLTESTAVGEAKEDKVKVRQLATELHLRLATDLFLAGPEDVAPRVDSQGHCHFRDTIHDTTTVRGRRRLNVHGTHAALVELRAKGVLESGRTESHELALEVLEGALGLLATGGDDTDRNGLFGSGKGGQTTAWRCRLGRKDRHVGDVPCASRLVEHCFGQAHHGRVILVVVVA